MCAERLVVRWIIQDGLISTYPNSINSEVLSTSKSVCGGPGTVAVSCCPRI